MDFKTFRAKVTEHVIATVELGFLPVQATAVDGIIIVKDSKGEKEEFDTYFDPDKWEFRIPKIWAPVDPNGVGILPGLGRFPRVQSFEEAIRFAASQLQSKNPQASWYPQHRLLN